jgi:predicted Fe-Mo cluster-binding NifX family protein
VSEILRVAVPTNGTGGVDAQRSAHFGHADSFTVLEIQDGVIVTDRAIGNQQENHSCGATVATLASQGVSSAIVVGMGRGPLAAMEQNGMTAYFDDQSPTPRAAVEALMAGRLRPFGSEQSCSGHH